MLFVYFAIIAQSISICLSKIASIRYTGIDRYLNSWYILALVFLIIQALVWQQALKRIPLSVAYPMMSLVFVIIPILSLIVFGEAISVLQILGTMIIIIGTIQIGRGNKRRNSDG